MRKITAFVLTTLMVFALVIPANAWELDKAHSAVEFSVSHLAISKVRGEFSDYSVCLMWDGKDLKGGSVTFTVMSTSVDTDNEKRDNHLRSDDFFNAEKYPDIKFVSKTVTPGEGNKFKLTGDLTIRDVTKEVTFNCEYNGMVEMMGATRAGFAAQTSINRHDFNVKFNSLLETGGFVVGGDVKLELELEFVKNAGEEKPCD